MILANPMMISRLLSSNDDELHTSSAILFPWLTSLVGIVIYYVLSRYAHGLPTTAVMFLIGALESPHLCICLSLIASVHYEVSMV